MSGLARRCLAPDYGGTQTSWPVSPSSTRYNTSGSTARRDTTTATTRQGARGDSSESFKQNRPRSVLWNNLNASIISFGTRATALNVAYSICRPHEIIRAMAIEILS